MEPFGVALAKRLLRETALPVEQIARRCGFASGQHLAGIFKRLTGLTAGGWREGG